MDDGISRCYARCSCVGGHPRRGGGGSNFLQREGEEEGGGSEAGRLPETVAFPECIASHQGVVSLRSCSASSFRSQAPVESASSCGAETAAELTALSPSGLTGKTTGPALLRLSTQRSAGRRCSPLPLPVTYYPAASTSLAQHNTGNNIAHSSLPLCTRHTSAYQAIAFVTNDSRGLSTLSPSRFQRFSSFPISPHLEATLGCCTSYLHSSSLLPFFPPFFREGWVPASVPRVRCVG